MRQTDLYRSGKPPERLSRNCFELLVKSIIAFVTLLASRFLDWVQRARWCTQSRSRMPGSSRLLCMGVLRHELPDQQVLDYPIIANGLIAPLVTMSCRLLLRRVASRGVLPRERFSPLAPSSGWAVSAFPPLSGDKQTSGEGAKNDASDPLQTWGTAARYSGRARLGRYSLPLPVHCRQRTDYRPRAQRYTNDDHRPEGEEQEVRYQALSDDITPKPERCCARYDQQRTGKADFDPRRWAWVTTREMKRPPCSHEGKDYPQDATRKHGATTSFKSDLKRYVRSVHKQFICGSENSALSLSRTDPADRSHV
jgi:hypothetical protein